jgi:hypothetical protein
LVLQMLKTLVLHLLVESLNVEAHLYGDRAASSSARGIDARSQLHAAACG